MGQIQVMSPALANQIAAGEVVERPASCVKELLDNSLDAGASKVSIALEEGGISAIVVEDNGKGMDKEDAVLAFARHATSKLKTEYELTRIMTLGFRGEALASIAAVSRVRLQTRSEKEEHGWVVTAEGSDATNVPEPIGMASGTTVEVRDLFFNTPARLKYLRTVHTEQARCVEVVQRAALSRPDVAFRLEVDHRILFQTPGKNKVLDVLATLYGVGEARQFLKVDMETPDYRVYGYIGRPTQGKSSRTHANWFLNERSIRNIGLHQAVMKGYQGRLMINKHPVYALYLKMNATLVDVNIHPHKSEVRFSEERDVTRLVQEAVSQALEQAFLVPGADRSRDNWHHNGPQSLQKDLGLKEEHGPRVRDSYEPRRPSSAEEIAAAKDLFRTTHTSTGLVPSGNGSVGAVIHEQKQPLETDKDDAVSVDKDPVSEAKLEPRETTYADAAEAVPEAAQRDGDRTKGVIEPSHATEEDRGDSDASGEDTTNRLQHIDGERSVEATRRQLRALRPIGQVLGTYILAEADNALFVIDQHAAHERVLYERFREQTQASHTGSIPLLTPITLTLTPQQHAVCTTHLELLKTLGIGVEEFGGYEIIVRTIPHVWEGLDAPVLLEELLQQLTEVGRHQDVREALREKIIMRACKSAIKANHRLSEMEISALCQALPDLDDPFHCPHGRPVLIRLSNEDLEKEFRRIV
ncbi:DNA mismatch repair endonuclease MutL [Alicyclobacillus sp. SO9]|uniref:DNA mismatch repair endonuclease MutL n=1 Tax=Alicyclobacillus sp. SO9 TaxID=2665646 RepID=UPI0018E70342|nr:DNA mismatch repair endonuclease MutL [Alicyclobacillus sp. SO9]QQE80968.1 DNA mismatch repair endonuclease MutL [Alicyclobacillus sp. SO9]